MLRIFPQACAIYCKESKKEYGLKSIYCTESACDYDIENVAKRSGRWKTWLKRLNCNFSEIPAKMPRN